jgi:hypothetical protein
MQGIYDLRPKVLLFSNEKLFSLVYWVPHSLMSADLHATGYCPIDRGSEIPTI